MGGLLGWLQSALSAVMSAVWAVVQHVEAFFVSIWDSCVATFVEWFMEPLGFWRDHVWEPARELLSQALLPEGNLRSAVYVITYFVPLVALVQIVASGYIVCGVIRIFRWVKSCVPFVGD